MILNFQHFKSLLDPESYFPKTNESSIAFQAVAEVHAEDADHEGLRDDASFWTDFRPLSSCRGLRLLLITLAAAIA